MLVYLAGTGAARDDDLAGRLLQSGVHFGAMPVGSALALSMISSRRGVFGIAISKLTGQCKKGLRDYSKAFDAEGGT